MAQLAPGHVWQDLADGLRRLLGGGWTPEQQPIAALLDLLVRGSKLQDDLRASELDAPALSFREPEAEEARLAREELDTARADLPEFEHALRDAYARSGGTDREVVFDSRNPAQDRAADLLIRYLVTTRTATVRSDEQPDGGYRYQLAVHWDTLFALAPHLGITTEALQAALRDHEPS